MDEFLACGADWALMYLHRLLRVRWRYWVGLPEASRVLVSRPRMCSAVVRSLGHARRGCVFHAVRSTAWTGEALRVRQRENAWSAASDIGTTLLSMLNAQDRALKRPGGELSPPGRHRNVADRLASELEPGLSSSPIL